MKILYVLPDGTVKTGGNWVTATRLSLGLENRGIIVDLIEAKNVTKEILIKYDIIHAFHVFKSLCRIRPFLVNLDKKIVVSFTGTDLKQLQDTNKNKIEIIDFLNTLEAVIVFHNEDREELIREGIFDKKIKIIPQAVMPMLQKSKGRRHSIVNGSFSPNVTFLFASGMRKVKSPLEMLELMSGLEKKEKNIQLVLIGPILEKELEAKISEKIKGKKWIKYLGEVSHQEVQEHILAADIIINTSSSEGMPNTLLEAHQMGKPVLATDIAGNRAVVTHGVDGFLFKEKDEFEYYATKLVENKKLRMKMGLSGMEMRKKYNWEQEVDQYEQVYQNQARYRRRF